MKIGRGRTLGVWPFDGEVAAVETIANISAAMDEATDRLLVCMEGILQVRGRCLWLTTVEEIHTGTGSCQTAWHRARMSPSGREEKSGNGQKRPSLHSYLKRRAILT